MSKILICTVGGSHQPIVSAIDEIRPDYVVFICTDKDPATGKAGSRSEIEGKGIFIKANRLDDKPSLPNIPTQTGLSDAQYQVVATQSDDLDRIYLDCRAAIDELRQRFPDATIIADYTGGTKSMSAGLVMAALDYHPVQLQIVTGSRSDLIKVQEGSQFAAAATSEHLRYQRMSEPYRKAWHRYAYSEAEAGLKALDAPTNAQLRGQYTRFRELSRAFAEWDNFNHSAAHTILHHHATPALAPYIVAARSLNDADPAKRDAARLYDLYLNALRRAAQGRYDDAVARVYRLIEWTAQWLLAQRCGIKTADVRPEQLPETLQRQPNRNGVIQLGLFDAWQLVKVKIDTEAAVFINQEERNLLNYLQMRNQSILAHGFEPVVANHWRNLAQWLETSFIPMLKLELAQSGIKKTMPQLPNEYQA